jgi:CHAT domain-containing protein
MREEVATASARGGRRALVVFLTSALAACHRQESASERLLALAPRSGRPIEARLTGFDWQAMRLQRATPAGLLDPARLELAGAASTVIQSLLNNPSAQARHESGAAYLLIERDRDAIDALESAVQQSPKEAPYWSDLAAARYTHAVRERRPHELPQALADADHALRLSPALPDALFNRALIVESLGITEAARRAWERYVATDPSTHWSSEAMNHMGRLVAAQTRDEFQRQLDVARGALSHGDDGPITALARNHPQEARTWSEGPLLGNWADAVRAGKTKTADETLAVVRAFGLALAQINHDKSIADAVAAIDRVAGDPAGYRALAHAQAVYRDGRLLYRDRRIADAQKKFKESEELFALGSSTMALFADYYLAGCVYDSNQTAEAASTLDNLAARFDHDRYPALLAEIGWNRALCQGSVGEWSAAIRTVEESRRIFDGLGETENRGEMDLLLAADLNWASQPAAAWKARVAAFQVLSRAGSYDRIRNSLITATNAEQAQGRLEASLSLAKIALEDIRQAKQPTAICLAEATRAEVLAKIGEMIGAQSAVERARDSAKAISDLDLRRRMSAYVDIVEAGVKRDANPSLSLRLINGAIDFLTSEHLNIWLPKAYLERGRTHIRGDDAAAALIDFEAGLRTVEAQRSSLTDRNLRGTFYDTEPELFSETIALMLHRGDTARAFEYSDGARARSIFEQLGHERTPAGGTTAKQLQTAIAPSTALLEYALLHDAIVIFYFSPSGSGAVRVATTPFAVRSLVERYTDLLQHRGELGAVQNASAALYRLLIQPVSAVVSGAEHLVIVPDREIHAVPFAALYDSTQGHYLIDNVAVSVAPSAGALLVGRDPLTLAPVLVVGDPHDEGAPSLPEAASEADSIAAMYDSSTLLTGTRATRRRFITAALRSGMIHYSGHAESNSADPFGALHLVADNPHQSGDLDRNAIAALHLGNRPLVILAACGTIRGDSAHVEGMPSIARAFLAAGARGVVGTLWEVDDDAVAPLFRRLHVELHNGANPSAALRAAQIALAHDPDPRLSHPSTWAPVELLGYSSEQRTSAKKGSE